MAELKRLFQLGQLHLAELALRAARALGGQGLLAPAASARRQRFADIRDTRNRFATSHSPRLDQLGRLQPHLLAAGPLRGGQPAAIGVPDDTGIHPTSGRRQKP